jgi:hypothetical protein
MREHRYAGTHLRVQQVRSFRMLARQLLATSAISTVSPLVGIARPNYVLQHDSRYQVLWQAYVWLVRQQMLEDSVWRWRHRLWAEHCGIGLMAALEHLSDRSSPRFDVLLQNEQDAGRFIDPRSFAGPWTIRHNSGQVRAYLIGGHQTNSHPAISAGLRSLCPDWIVVFDHTAEQPASVLAVWALLDFEIETASLNDRLSSLAVACSERAGPNVRALLLQPKLSNSSDYAEGISVSQSGDAAALQISLPLQQQLTQLAEWIRWGLPGK